MQKNICITFIFNFLSLREESVDARPPAVALANPFGSGEEDRRWVTHGWCAVTEQLLSGHSVDFGCCVVLMMWTAPYTDKITWAITLLYVAIMMFFSIMLSKYILSSRILQIQWFTFGIWVHLSVTIQLHSRMNWPILNCRPNLFWGTVTLWT